VAKESWFIIRSECNVESKVVAYKKLK
jgi:hypothetical protein